MISVDLIHLLFAVSFFQTLFRLTFYKRVANTNLLNVTGNFDSMCGDTLKLVFKCKMKVFMKLSQGKT